MGYVGEGKEGKEMELAVWRENPVRERECIKRGNM